MIQIRNVSKTFEGKGGRIEALKNVSLNVEKGDIFGVVGFSGAGKSTLLRLVNQLETQDQGVVLVQGIDVKKAPPGKLRDVRKNIGMIFQQFNLLSSGDVSRNIAMPMILEGWGREKIDKRVSELLAFVGLEDRRNASVNKLSGGQKQRVGIARALALNPSILLCDEGTSALDPRTTESILELLRMINQELGVTILLITHEMNVIQKICNKVAVMEAGEIVEQGEVIRVFSKPECGITKAFVKTVIQDQIPVSILDLIEKDPKRSRVVKLTFLGENTKSSLISELNKGFDIKTTILYASVNEIQNQILGLLILNLLGEEEEMERAIEFIQKAGVELEEVWV